VITLLMVIAFGVLMGGWLALGLLMDRRITRRTVPERWVVHVLPGWLPSYVRRDAEYARQARARQRAGKPRG